MTVYIVYTLNIPHRKILGIYWDRSIAILRQTSTKEWTGIVSIPIDQDVEVDL